MVNIKNIDLNLLHVFQEVFHARQISSAAKKLGLSQPAVSSALIRLRLSLGDELFVRTAQGMQPTPFAQQLAAPIARALNDLDRALNHDVLFDQAETARQFTLAMTDVAEVYFMPRLVALCKEIAPEVQLKTVRAGTIDFKTEMETGRLDLAIGAFDTMSGALFQRRLFKQSYVCMMRSTHPLSNKSLELKSFLSAQHLIVGTGDSTNESTNANVNAALQKLGIQLNAHCIVPHFVAVPYMLAATDLIATVPQKFAERSASPFELVWHKAPCRLPTLQTNMFWHRRYQRDEGGIWLRKLIANAFSE